MAKEKKNGKKNGKAIGKSLTPKQREYLQETIPTLPTELLKEMGRRIDDAQKLSAECIFSDFDIDFSKITPACCRWTVKIIDQELAERQEDARDYFEY